MKTISLTINTDSIQIEVPDSCDILSAGKSKPLPDPVEAVNRSLSNPTGSPPLNHLAKGKKTAVVVVSDNTRPVPYKEPDGILAPIIKTLKQSGVPQITILIACGTHRPMEQTELKEMLGNSAFQNGVEVINHVATDNSMLRIIGGTERTAEVSINKRYLDADLKIATGLVESHFMAGFSGGPKAICPGVSGRAVTYGFHSASIINHEKATSMSTDGNPCYEESTRIAEMAGVDFVVNVTIDSDKKLTGVFSGQLRKAHAESIRHLRKTVSIPVDHLYDLVITSAGAVGVNHYQCAKPAFEACRALKPGGRIILPADLTDLDPVGNQSYKQTQRILVQSGAKSFIEKILSDEWTFIPDQWQSQMWAKVFLHLEDPKNLFICAAQLQETPDSLIPETNVAAQLAKAPDESNIDFVQRMAQRKIDECILKYSPENIALLADGPYAIPVLY